MNADLSWTYLKPLNICIQMWTKIILINPDIMIFSRRHLQNNQKLNWAWNNQPITYIIKSLMFQVASSFRKVAMMIVNAHLLFL